MNMDNKIEEFLNMLEDEDNKPLIEAVKSGVTTILEGYADVVTPREHQSAVERFNERGANLAASMGNHLMSFLLNSTKALKSRFSSDGESGLDSNPTAAKQFNEYTQPDDRSYNRPSRESPRYDEIEDSLGLTIDEIK